MTPENIEKARRQFIKASAEFDFTFISPYLLDEQKGLFAFGFIDDFGSKEGIVIDLLEPPFYEGNRDVACWCEECGRCISRISAVPLLEEYDSSYFKAMLDDWRI